MTGASSGIGAATARALAAEGASVTLCARRRAKLDEVARDCPGSEVLELDVRDAAGLAAAFEGRSFDLVVANAGLALGAGKLVDGDPADWSVMVDTNVLGVLNVLRAALPGLVRAGRGDVVLLGSVAGREVYPGGNVYCATKHAVRALYQALRVEHVGAGLRFCTVDPGMVETDFSRVRFRGDAARAAAVYEGLQPLTAADVADAILWAVTRPPHVNIGEIVLWPTDQASTTLAHRRRG